MAENPEGHGEGVAKLVVVGLKSRLHALRAPSSHLKISYKPVLQVARATA